MSYKYIQSNLKGSTRFGPIKICSNDAKFEHMSVNRSAMSGGVKRMSF